MKIAFSNFLNIVPSKYKTFFLKSKLLALIYSVGLKRVEMNLLKNWSNSSCCFSGVSDKDELVGAVLGWSSPACCSRACSMLSASGVAEAGGAGGSEASGSVRLISSAVKNSDDSKPGLVYSSTPL